MLKFLSTVVNSGVVSDAVSGNGKPSGYVKQEGLSTEGIIAIVVYCLLSFMLGIIVEKIIRFFKDCKKINKQYKNNEDEE